MTGRSRLAAYALLLGLAGVGGAGLGAAIGPTPADQPTGHAEHQMAPAPGEQEHED